MVFDDLRKYFKVVPVLFKYGRHLVQPGYPAYPDLGVGFFQETKQIGHAWLGQGSAVRKEPLCLRAAGIGYQGFIGAIAFDATCQL